MHVERIELELESLMARLERQELHPRGDTSRPGGWDEQRQQRFIDTILREWCVPEIHIAADPADPDVGEVVLDGAQRLLTLLRFFRDELPCSGEQAPGHDEVRRLDGLRFSDLPGDVQRRVRRFRMTVVVLSDYRPAELRELLDRLRPSDEPDIPVPSPRAPTHRSPVSPEPIYDQVSAWFADLSEFRALSEASGDAVAWSSPADAGQAAAEAAVEPDGADLAGVTAAGLPQREPRALLVPGAVPPPAGGALSFGAPGASPHEVAERLASYRDGVTEGSGEERTDDVSPHPMFDDGGAPQSR
ncbi:DUF262 domain-containing protein [Actinomycetospora lutea]|uniref:DUF262 domain-containing protein n=1 Tax=Actinomycetospora lutea TaxID=663604 RepID=UPI0023654E3D|nr:DUF262 domain-containing protein [Actinomycetospora lutea]MDD7942348.1 DUF262 domain-containing protein [Actinomycetospora lutea]